MYWLLNTSLKFLLEILVVETFATVLVVRDFSVTFGADSFVGACTFPGAVSVCNFWVWVTVVEAGFMLVAVKNKVL